MKPLRITAVASAAIAIAALLLAKHLSAPSPSIQICKVESKVLAIQICEDARIIADHPVPVQVGNGGTILTLLPLGSPVSKGDVIATIDVSEALLKIPAMERELQSLNHKLELAQAQLRQTAESNETLIFEAQSRYEEASTRLEYEASSPHPEELRLLEIARDQAKIDCQRAERLLAADQRLADAGFLSIPALEQRQRRLATAQAALDSTQLAIDIACKGILPQRRAQLETAFERAKADLDRARAAAERSLQLQEAQVAAAATAISSFQINLERTRSIASQSHVTAPASGLLSINSTRDWMGGGIMRPYAPGKSADQGDVIATIIDPARMRLSCQISAAELHLIPEDAMVQVSFPALPGKTARARIIHRSGLAQDRSFFLPVSSGSAGVSLCSLEIAFLKEESLPGLHPGMSARVVITLAPPVERLLIPRSAAIILPDGLARVFIQTPDGSLHPLQVSVRHADAFHLEVVQGLAAGQPLAADALLAQAAQAAP